MSIVNIAIGKQRFRVDSKKGVDLSIPLHFQGKQLSAYGADPPTAESFQNGDFLGDTRKGASCNVQRYTFVPHCHGTHTECVGHIVDEPVTIPETLDDVWIPATLISIRTENRFVCSDHYSSKTNLEDKLISKASVVQAIQAYTEVQFHQALIVRTLPNDPSKNTLRYTTAPYFSNDAMQEIVYHRVQHLLVDLPSVDRLEDQGQLSNHRIFWQMQGNLHTLGKQRASTKTITELIYVPNHIRDGYYFLNLQIPPLMTDAAPSRPIIFAVDS